MRMPRLALKFDPKLISPFWKTKFEEILLSMVAHYLELHCDLILKPPYYHYILFVDSNRGQHDTFGLVINFLIPN